MRIHHLLRRVAVLACFAVAVGGAMAQQRAVPSIEAIWRMGQQVGALQAALAQQQAPAARAHLQNVLALTDQLRCLNPAPWQSLQRRLDQGTPPMVLAAELEVLVETAPTPGPLVRNLDLCYALRVSKKMVPAVKPVPPLDPRVLLGRLFEWIDDGQRQGTVRFLDDGLMIPSWTDLMHTWRADDQGDLVVRGDGGRWVIRLHLQPTGEFRGERDAMSEVQDGVQIILRPVAVDTLR